MSGTSIFVRGCLVVCSIALVGCTFDPKGVPVDGDGGMVPDEGQPDAGPPPVVTNVAIVHLAEQPSWEGIDAEIVVDADLTIDTDAMGDISWRDGEPMTGWGFSYMAQIDGPEVALLQVHSLVIAEDVTLTVTGPHPLVIAALETMEINGTIDASANGKEPGPGGGKAGPDSLGYPDGAGTNGKKDGDNVSGGGGGSLGGEGADGGFVRLSATEVLEGGIGGKSFDALTTRVLLGGARGGKGENRCSGQSGNRADGGSGGGAVQLFADSSIVIGQWGGIDVSGGGGEGGIAGCGAGAGGGSGGMLVIQTQTLDLQGTLAANGGGGGQGAFSNDDGLPGAHGALGSDPALGGGQMLDNGQLAAETCDTEQSTGGQGGAQTAPACVGGESILRAGGGGGGVGWIIFHLPTDSLTTGTDAIISPEATRL